MVEKGQPVTMHSLLGDDPTNPELPARPASGIPSLPTAWSSILRENDDITSSLIDLSKEGPKPSPRDRKVFTSPRLLRRRRCVHRHKTTRTPCTDSGDEPKNPVAQRRLHCSLGLIPTSPRAARKPPALIARLEVDNLIEMVPVSNPVAVTQTDSVTLEPVTRESPSLIKSSASYLG